MRPARFRSRSGYSTPCIGALVCALAFGGCQERRVEVSLDAGVTIHDVKSGTGPEARDGLGVNVHYKAWLPDGTVLMNTYEKGSPHPFNVGDGTVIKGFDKAIRGMRAGGVREVTIPPMSHYGARGYGEKVPPDTPIMFRIEMVEVRPAW